MACLSFSSSTSVTLLPFFLPLPHSLFLSFCSSFSKWSIEGRRVLQHGFPAYCVVITNRNSHRWCIYSVYIWCRCALWGLERLRMVEMAYIRKLTRTLPVLRFGEPHWEDISDLVCEMGLTGNHLVTLLLYVAVVNEIRLPLVSSFLSVYDPFHLAASHSIVSCYDRPCFAAIFLLIGMRKVWRVDFKIVFLLRELLLRIGWVGSFFDRSCQNRMNRVGFWIIF